VQEAGHGPRDDILVFDALAVEEGVEIDLGGIHGLLLKVARADVLRVLVLGEGKVVPLTV
jgi:hypothetical protein